MFILERRVKKAIYGYNEFEAIEFINFILKYNNKDDFNDPGGLKKPLLHPESIFESEVAKGEREVYG